VKERIIAHVALQINVIAVWQRFKPRLWYLLQFFQCTRPSLLNVPRLATPSVATV